jgi:hypothetical protein
MAKVVALKTNREFYDIKDAMNESISVAEFIDLLSYLPQDAKIVFRNDGGYTYGYINEDVIKEY